MSTVPPASHPSREPAGLTVTACLFISLDGFVQAPETWHFPYADEQLLSVVQQQFEDADTLLLGRRTYEIFAGSWPAQGTRTPLAKRLNTMPRAVLTTTLPSTDAWPGTRLLRGGLDELATQLGGKSIGGPVVVVGSVSLVRGLLARGLLDRLELLVHPLVLGDGERLFHGVGRRDLSLLSGRCLDSGVVHLVHGCR